MTNGIEAGTHGSEDDGVEHSSGSGLGPRISLAEGRARLDRYASTMSAESWAGTLAEASEIEQNLRIPRSTLCRWREEGVILGLLRADGELGFPIEQFDGPRPVQGISAVVRVAVDERAAWLWLRQRHPALDDQAPIDALRQGNLDAVIRAAEGDFS